MTQTARRVEEGIDTFSSLVCYRPRRRAKGPLPRLSPLRQSSRETGFRVNSSPPGPEPSHHTRIKEAQETRCKSVLPQRDPLILQVSDWTYYTHSTAGQGIFHSRPFACDPFRWATLLQRRSEQGQAATRLVLYDAALKTGFPVTRQARVPVGGGIY
jgi:hypothetical protein